MTERVYLTVAEVLAIQHHLIEEYGGSLGVRDQGALEAAAFRPQTGYYDDVPEEAAALMESLANNHPFIDGNKRVSFAASHTFLPMNGLYLHLAPSKANDFMTGALPKGKSHSRDVLEWLSS